MKNVAWKQFVVMKEDGQEEYGFAGAKGAW